MNGLYQELSFSNDAFSNLDDGTIDLTYQETITLIVSYIAKDFAIINTLDRH